jgi:hypothetical protein
MAVVDAGGLPIGLRVFTAGEHEVRQAEETLMSCWTAYLPERVIADRVVAHFRLLRIRADRS